MGLFAFELCGRFEGLVLVAPKRRRDHHMVVPAKLLALTAFTVVETAVGRPNVHLLHPLASRAFGVVTGNSLGSLQVTRNTPRRVVAAEPIVLGDVTVLGVPSEVSHFSALSRDLYPPPRHRRSLLLLGFSR
jgi:hypothetical protein